MSASDTEQKPGYRIPDKYIKSISRLDTMGLALINKGDFAGAESVFRDQLDILMKAQKDTGHRIHKGATLHNLGLCLLMRKKGESVSFISAAFAEDVLSHGAVESLVYPASRLLIALGAKRGSLESVAEKVSRTFKVPDEILDTRELPQIRGRKLALLGLEIMVLPPELELPKEETVDSSRSPPASIMDKVDRNIAILGGSDTVKVFIGGSYQNIALLRHISVLVQNHGKVPVLVCDLPVPFSRKESYDGSMEMLEHCQYAVFEVSFHGGHMMEIERCHEIKKRREIKVLMSWQRPRWSGDAETSIPSKMLITKNFDNCRYTRLRGLSNKVVGFLK